MSEEKKVPTKEEIMTFLIEQIEVKELQAKLQEVNARLAKARAEELQAISYIAQLSGQRAPEEGMVPHILTEEDLESNPELEAQGLKVGDEVLVAKEEDSSEAKPKRNLKKQK